LVKGLFDGLLKIYKEMFETSWYLLELTAEPILNEENTISDLKVEWNRKQATPPFEVSSLSLPIKSFHKSTLDRP
jgi:hypothetical protein